MLLRAQQCSIVDPLATGGAAAVMDGDATSVSGALVAAAVRDRRVVTWREAIERPGKPITLRGVKGQIKSATLWLTPIE